MTAASSTPSNRIAAAAGAALLQGLLGYALLVGLTVHMPARIADSLKIFDIATPPPPPAERIVPRQTAARKRQGAAAPPNLKAKATEVVAPPPVIPLVAPPPVIAAPVAGIGNEPAAGASTRPGPGTGAGGQGNGTGSGTSGNGDGGGGDGTPSHWIKGRIKDSDYPRGPLAAKIGGTLLTRYVVGPNGHVAECRVIRSSGNADLDATTCRLIIERFRFEPARDAQGRKISDVVVEDHTWVIDE